MTLPNLQNVPKGLLKKLFSVYLFTLCDYLVGTYINAIGVDISFYYGLHKFFAGVVGTDLVTFH